MRHLLTYTFLVFSGALFAAIITSAVIVAREGDERKDPAVTDDSETSDLFYREGDWENMIFLPEYREIPRIDQQQNDDVFEYDGSVVLGLGYGKSMFTDSSYKLFPGDVPRSEVIHDDLFGRNEIQLLMQGHVGKRLTVLIDHDSRRERADENRYIVQYRAVNDDEVLRELNAGDVDIRVAKSKYAIFESSAEKAYGIDATLRKNDFTFKMFGSIAKGSNEVEVFRGNSSTGSIAIAEYQFIRDCYFQLEPYRRYDGITNSVTSASSTFGSLVTFTSAPASPQTYTPYSVALEKGSVELWYDDQTGIRKSDTYPGPPGGGDYIKLSEGVDYRVNYGTGEIAFIRSITERSRVFVLYRLDGGAATSDPAVIPVAGKNLVFIKYGTFIEQNPGHISTDLVGATRHDIYEIRSRYFIGYQKLKPDGFNLEIYKDNRRVTQSDSTRLGSYTVDYQSGIISYSLREPFRPLYEQPPVNDSITPKRIYGASTSELPDLSKYSQHIEFVRESASFQLSHMNILEGSVSVKVGGVTLPPSLYSVNYLAGSVEFSDPNNPVIGSTTTVEIRYQYSEMGEQTRTFMGGFRGDYRVNDALSVGGTLLYSQKGLNDRVPMPGAEPERLMVYEGDASLYLSPSRIGKVASAITGNSYVDLPIEMRGYAEYARSYRTVNTFGKMMIDDIETSGEALAVTLNENEWFISSMPNSLPQSSRATLNYLYYRDPSSPETLRGPGFTPYIIPYSTKPGPYNIMGGHNAFSSGDLNDNQRSLVFDFSLTTGTSAAAAVRLGSGEVDLSGLQYIEIWYRSTVSGANVDLQLDIGSLNEDSDGDGLLETEDVNRNGYLDFDMTHNIDEDTGYQFHTSNALPNTLVGGGPKLNTLTRGDGILSTEDINRNGILDTTEQSVSFPNATALCDDGSPTLPVSTGITSWKKKRIYLNRSALTPANREILAHSTAMRLSVTGSAGTTGTIWIDSIRLVSSKWRDIRIGGVSMEDPTRFSSTIVDSWNDDEYAAHSFATEQRGLYESLYGDRSSDEIHDERESALSIKYNLGASIGSVSRIFQKPINLKYYRTANIWYDIRSLGADNTMRVYLCSSEKDYIAYDIPVSTTGIGFWQEATLQLAADSSGRYPPAAVSGYPDLSHIRSLRIEITGGNSGCIWVNTIMASDPETVSDSAYWYEWSVKARRPLYVTEGGLRLFDGINFTVIQRKHGSEFDSPGRTDNGMYELAREFRGECIIIPNMTGSAMVSQVKTVADSNDDRFALSQRGRTDKGTLVMQVDYLSEKDFIPSWGVYYSGESSNNNRLESGLDTLGSPIRTEIISESHSHSPRISIDERFTDLFDGRWRLRFVSDNSFISQRNTRNETAPTYDGESRQKTDLQFQGEYSKGFFVLAPDAEIYNHEVTKYFGKTDLNGEILSDVNGGFHFPFIGGESNKFAERTLRGGWRLSLANIKWFNPSSTVSYRYAQNGFRDYSGIDLLSHPSFIRSHNAQGLAANELVFPFSFAQPIGGFFNTLNIRYQRSMSLDEQNVPYEGESTDQFDEKYGISRNFAHTAPESFNWIKYYPFSFLRGRGNFASGRDHLNNNLNGSLYLDGSRTTYDNSTMMYEDLSVSPGFSFGAFGLNLESGISDQCQRSGIQNAPGQNVSLREGGTLNIDLMKLFNWGFFRPNGGDLSEHRATCTIGYLFTRRMLITQNLLEDEHTPSLGFVFGWGTSSLTLKGGIDFRTRSTHEFISWDPNERSRSDDIYINAMSTTRIGEINRGYTFTAIYQRDVELLREFFSQLYPISTNPVFILEYDMMINRYDYSTTVSPEPYDQHLVTSQLSLDLHKNIKGGIIGRWALERWYNRDTHGLYREISSFEISGQLSIVF
jgi:hypothetical protein